MHFAQRLFELRSDTVDHRLLEGSLDAHDRLLELLDLGLAIRTKVTFDNDREESKQRKKRDQDAKLEIRKTYFSFLKKEGGIF